MTIRLNSALIVGCLTVLLAASSKIFLKASLSLMKEQFSRLAKSATSNIFSYFVSFRLHERKTDLGLDTERFNIASFVVGSKKSLASQFKIDRLQIILVAEKYISNYRTF